VTYGGLPLTVTMKTEEQKIQYLTTLFNETYIKDIIEQNHIEKVQELNDLINVIASSIGALSNPSKIEDAFVINEAQRYDVKGRNTYYGKYYL
jgi:predicted AAA+ superfamily ATPase